MTSSGEDPNDRNYSPVNIGTLSSTSEVNTFFSRFNHTNGYKDGDTRLRIGNRITINDGTYNAVWVIAGFDLEHNQIAADGTVYDNGYGICLVPDTYLGNSEYTWNDYQTISGGYNTSTIHTTHLPTVVNTLKNILGSHIVSRNVLLSSSILGYYSNAYTWTTAYATLMSFGQLNGIFASYYNKYDDGEANYRLPLFIFEDYKSSNNSFNYWLRGLAGLHLNSGSQLAYMVYTSSSYANRINYTSRIRPLIYVR